MPNTKKTDSKILEELRILMLSSVAIQMWKGGLTQEEIRKRLGVSKQFINSIVKGIKQNQN